MPYRDLAQKLLLPELLLKKVSWNEANSVWTLELEKHSSFEVCPKCATRAYTVHDRRSVRCKDHPVMGKLLVLNILKRRFRCGGCNAVFTEPVPGIQKGARSTERYRRGLLWACENFADLKSVCRAFRCSTGVLYRTLYKQLELKQRQYRYPWPKTLGIDEHFFKRGRFGEREFATAFVDYKNKRVVDMQLGRSYAELKPALCNMKGAEHVQNVVIDLSESYRKFSREYFPNAVITADHFHVVRLLHPAINRRRKAITGDKRKLPVRKLLLKNAHKLKNEDRRRLRGWLKQHPELFEVWLYKEALHRLYRCRGHKRAKQSLTKLLCAMANSTLPEIKTLRKTLMKWSTEILNYFKTKLTNGRTEGYNHKFKLVKRRAYGYRSFSNYRLRCLQACR